MSEPIKTREELEAIREDIDSLAAVSGATALRLLATIDVMARVLADVEWAGQEHCAVGLEGAIRYRTCPKCFREEPDGHSPDCGIAPWVRLRRKTHGN